jgi:hypothetical protein
VSLAHAQDHGQARLAVHQSQKKLAESASGGTDPYVVAYLGLVRDKRTQTVQTESVVASDDNDRGRNPVWTAKGCRTIDGAPANNVLHITPGPSDVHLTLEIWDSDIMHDDFLGGRTLKLAELKDELDSLGGSATMHIQIFDQDGNQGYERGHDAGVVQIQLSYEKQGADGERVFDATAKTLRIEVQAAIDLLPDTPAIRDLTTFADWKNTIRMAIALGAYMFAFTVYFGWFFSEYACTSAGNIQCTNATGTFEYPDKLGHPLLDAVLFMLGSTTTVGWGSQPVNFVSPPDQEEDGGGSSAASWFSFTKLLLSMQVLIGIVLIGLLIGSLGESFRSLMQKNQQLVYDGMAKTPLVETPAVGEASKLDHPEKGACGSVGKLELALLSLLTVILLGSFAFCYLDDLSFVDAFYLTVVTVSTVGYGDLAPSSLYSKIFACFFVPLGVAFVASAIDLVSSRITSAREDELEKFVLGQFGERGSLESNDLTAFDFEELQRATQVKYGAPMSRNDFRLAMLLRLGRVEHDDMKMIDQVFTTLDADGSGFIDQSDVVGEQECAMTRRVERLKQRWAEGKEEEDGSLTPEISDT